MGDKKKKQNSQLDHVAPETPVRLSIEKLIYGIFVGGAFLFSAGATYSVWNDTREEVAELKSSLKDVGDKVNQLDVKLTELNVKVDLLLKK